MSGSIELDLNIKGLDTVVNVLNSLPDKIALRALTRSTAKIAADIKAQLQAKAPIGEHNPIKVKNKSPRRAGNLKRSVKFKKAKGKDLPTYYIGPRAFYGRFLEFGTKKMPAHPWLYAAWEAIDKQALVEKQVGILKQEIGRALGYKVA